MSDGWDCAMPGEGYAAMAGLVDTGLLTDNRIFQGLAGTPVCKP